MLTTRQNLDYYNVHAPELADRYLSADVEVLHRELNGCFSSCKRLLELGSGSGRDTSFMLEQGFDVFGIDGSVSMIQESLKRFPQLEGRIRYGILPDEFPDFETPFDGIYSIAMLMHLEGESLMKTLKYCYINLKTGGKMYLSVPEGRELEPGEVRRTNGYNLDMWKNSLEESGFHVQKNTRTEDGLGRHRYWYNFTLEKL